MRRLMTFLMGMLAGGLLLWGAMQYHVLRTKEGLRLVPKVDAKLAGTYVDIRNFTVADWTRHTDLAVALANAGHRDLMENAANDALQNGIDRLFKREDVR